MIQASARGNFRELGAKLRPFIARRVRSTADADDVLQEVLLRIQRGLPILREEERFGPWVYQIARSVLIDHLRAARAPEVSGVELSPADLSRADALEEPLGSDDDAASEELASYVAAFVAVLPSPYREALTLTELEGLTQKEAAEMLGVSLSGMKSRVQRGRLLLKKAFEECCHIALDVRGRVVSFEPRADGRVPDGCCK